MEIMTKRAKPTAASQAANTRIVIGSMNANRKWLFRVSEAVIINRDNIIPSRHSRVDIRCEWNIRVPIRAREKASIKFI